MAHSAYPRATTFHYLNSLGTGRRPLTNPQHALRRTLSTNSRLKRARLFVVASVTALLPACRHSGNTTAAQSSTTARVPAIISADSGWPPYWYGPMLIAPLEEHGPWQIRIQRGPRYPDYERSEGQQAVAIAAMIVDTSGRVIVPSLRFVNAPHAAFQRSICDYASRAMFTPARANERPAAALVVMPFSFSLGDNPVRSPPTLEVEKLLRSLPPSQRHAWLSKKPSC
jgi:TonB family protein